MPPIPDPKSTADNDEDISLWTLLFKVIRIVLLGAIAYSMYIFFVAAKDTAFKEARLLEHTLALNETETLPNLGLLPATSFSPYIPQYTTSAITVHVLDTPDFKFYNVCAVLLDTTRKSYPLHTSLQNPHAFSSSNNVSLKQKMDAQCQELFETDFNPL
jgi:hypothetical protein